MSTAYNDNMPVETSMMLAGGCVRTLQCIVQPHRLELHAARRAWVAVGSEGWNHLATVLTREPEVGRAFVSRISCFGAGRRFSMSCCLGHAAAVWPYAVSLYLPGNV